MPKFIDRSGHRYGRLVAIERAGHTETNKILWRCVCDCGNETFVDTCRLVTGNTTSCGCYLKERITKHSGSNKSSYNTWRAMQRRCNNPKDKDYKRYGALGITICLEWGDYLKFAADMGEPEGAQTLDRIDPYGNYNKQNCRWASLPVQARNVRVRSTTESGVTGVSRVYKDKWMAKITINKKAYYSKVVTSIEEAAAARKELERKYWGTC